MARSLGNAVGEFKRASREKPPRMAG